MGRLTRGPREQRSGRRDGVLRAHHRVPARLRRGAGRRRARKPDQGVSRGSPNSLLPPSSSANRQRSGSCSTRPFPASLSDLAGLARSRTSRRMPVARSRRPSGRGARRAGRRGRPSCPDLRRSWRCCGGSSAAWRCLTGLADLGGVWPTEAALEAMSATADAVLRAGDGVSVPQGARGRPDHAAKPTRRRRRPAISSSPWASSAPSS